MNVNPYLGFDGRCAEAFRFYEQVLGATIKVMMTHENTPMAAHVPPDWVDKILHGQISIEGQIIMASDAPPGRYEAAKGISICLQPTTVAEAERIFADLSQGGSVQMALAPTFWSADFGMLTDKFGIPWLVSCDVAN